MHTAGNDGTGVGTERRAPTVRRAAWRLAGRRGVSGVVALAVALWAGAAPAQQLELLRAQFDDKPVDQPIGLGGAAVGEPFLVPEGLSAIVRAEGGSNRWLEISADTLVSAAAVQFGLLGDAGVQIGTVQMDVTLTMPTFGVCSIAIREPRWSVHNFSTVSFQDSGDVTAHDAAGSFALAAYSYVPGVPQHVRLTFDMDAGSYDIALNGSLLVTGRAHGITGAGVGQIQITVPYAAPPQLYFIDDIVVTWMFPDPVFADSFDGEPAASP